MGSRYVTWPTGTSALTAAASGVAVTTTTKTLLQALPDPNYPSTIIQWGYNFVGSTLPTTPVQMELIVTGTVFATVTSGSVTKWGSSTGPSSQATVGTSATGYGPASAEGTITSTRLLDQHSYPADWASQFPLGREPVVAAGECVRIRGTCLGSSATASVIPFIIWEVG
jgi:hypothetical protein